MPISPPLFFLQVPNWVSSTIWSSSPGDQVECCPPPTGVLWGGGFTQESRDQDESNCAGQVWAINPFMGLAWSCQENLALMFVAGVNTLLGLCASVCVELRTLAKVGGFLRFSIE